jgi:transposase-like protein
MPWNEVSIMSLRWEFVELASQRGVNFSEVCRRFQISRNNGYKWVKRYQRQGVEGLANRSHRPQQSPHRSPEAIEQKVLWVREEHPVWGARKIGARLRQLEETMIPAECLASARPFGVIQSPCGPRSRTEFGRSISVPTKLLNSISEAANPING